jgi:hypothetical protein
MKSFSTKYYRDTSPEFKDMFKVEFRLQNKSISLTNFLTQSRITNTLSRMIEIGLLFDNTNQGEDFWYDIIAELELNPLYLKTWKPNG